MSESLLPLCARLTQAIALAEKHMEERQAFGRLDDAGRQRALDMARQRIHDALRTVAVLRKYIGRRCAQYDLPEVTR